MARRKKVRDTITQYDFRRPRRDANVLIEFATNGGNPNKGRMSPAEFSAAQAAYNRGNGPCPHIYQPVLIEVAQLVGAKVATSGRGNAKP